MSVKSQLSAELAHGIVIVKASRMRIRLMVLQYRYHKAY